MKGKKGKKKGKKKKPRYVHLADRVSALERYVDGVCEEHPEYSPDLVRFVIRRFLYDLSYFMRSPDKLKDGEIYLRGFLRFLHVSRFLKRRDDFNRIERAAWRARYKKMPKVKAVRYKDEKGLLRWRYETVTEEEE